MTNPTISSILKFFPTVFFACITWLIVYKQMKTENISFKEYLIRRKNRLYIALVFILFSIGYGIYSIATIPH